MSNLYRQFLDLLPARPLQVGTVTATDGSTCTVQLPGGGVLQARGAATVASKSLCAMGSSKAMRPRSRLWPSKSKKPP